jgi:hypothetical protein
VRTRSVSKNNSMFLRRDDALDVAPRRALAKQQLGLTNKCTNQPTVQPDFAELHVSVCVCVCVSESKNC